MDRAADEDDAALPHWRRNLAVCVAGSFTTIVAMTILLPFLPLMVRALGVRGEAAIAEWSGAAYAATFLSAAFVAPLWGRLADRYGSKLMLVRASLGMTVAMSLIGFARSAPELVGIRLFAGLAGGYASGSNIAVAAGTPRARTGWALGVLSAGMMAGNLVGPLVGGFLPPLVGIRATFLLAGGLIFAAFLATLLLLDDRGLRRIRGRAAPDADTPPAPFPADARRAVRTMLIAAALAMFANMSVEPIIALFVARFVQAPAGITRIAGFAMSAAALGSILAAPRLGRLADRIGHRRVVALSLLAAAALAVPQAYAPSAAVLVGLRFLMGAALGGVLPCATAALRHAAPPGSVGRVLGLSTSAQYAGQVAGPLLGGVVAGHLGMRAVFLGTGIVLLCGAALAARRDRA